MEHQNAIFDGKKEKFGSEVHCVQFRKTMAGNGKITLIESILAEKVLYIILLILI